MSADEPSSGVGPGRPPKHSQFRRGESGNPKGRPKGTSNLKTDLANMLKAKVEITINGEKHRMTRQEAVLLSLFQRALLKDARAAKTLFDMVIKLQLPDEHGTADEIVSAADHLIIEDFLRRKHSQKSE